MTWWRKREQSRTYTDEARAYLAALDEREPRVDRVTAELRRARDRNHFADLVRAAFAARREA